MQPHDADFELVLGCVAETVVSLANLSRDLLWHLLHDDEGGHGLNNRYSARYDARVMTTSSGQHTALARVLGGTLLLRDRRGRFECNSACT